MVSFRYQKLLLTHGSHTRWLLIPRCARLKKKVKFDRWRYKQMPTTDQTTCYTPPCASYSDQPSSEGSMIKPKIQHQSLLIEVSAENPKLFVQTCFCSRRSEAKKVLKSYFYIFFLQLLRVFNACTECPKNLYCICGILKQIAVQFWYIQYVSKI